MSVSTYNDFSAGMVRDPANGSLPDNAVADAVDVFFDVPSKIRRRSATLKPSGATSATAAAMQIGYTNNYVYIVKKDASLAVVDQGTGAFTTLSTATSSPLMFGKPVSFFGILMFPTYGDPLSAVIPAVYRADPSGFNTYSPPAGTVATVTAGSNIVAFSNGDFFANTQGNGGQLIYITDSGAGTPNIYIGQFGALSAHTIYVDPVPTKSFSATQGVGTGAFVSSSYPAFNLTCAPGVGFFNYAARTMAIHQNRVLLGGASRMNLSTSRYEDHPRSVYYTILPTGEAPSANPNAQGHAWFFQEGIEPNNRFDIGGSDPILALASIDDNEVLILTASAAWRLSGYLATRVTNDAGGVTYDVHIVPRSPGLLSERSVQQTPHGLVMASQDDLYIYAGGQFRGLLGRGNRKYWKGMLSNRSVLGSHMLDDDTYVISIGTDNFGGGVGGGDIQTHAYHLPTQTLSRLTGNSLVLFDAVKGRGADISTNRIGVRWWDASASAPSMTGSQVVFTGQVTDPIHGILGSDSDGNNIAPAITTRFYDEKAPDQKKRFWRTVWRVQGLPTITINTIERVIAGSGTYATIGTMGTAGFASYTGPVVATRGIQYTITAPSPSTAHFDILGFDHYYDVLPYARAS